MAKATKVKAIVLLEDGISNVGYGFTGLVLELEDGRIMTHNSTDPMQQFNEMKQEGEIYEAVTDLMNKALTPTPQSTDVKE